LFNKKKIASRNGLGVDTPHRRSKTGKRRSEGEVDKPLVNHQGRGGDQGSRNRPYKIQADGGEPQKGWESHRRAIEGTGPARLHEKEALQNPGG